jgi:malonate-semialdehyde dehydrogenase (acetylating)/methylmalonate-semialdehyde dehydrogenase
MGEFAENVAGGVDTYTLRQPIGVCAGITPFNFPAMIPLWMFPMAIVCGNTFVLKPSEQDPLSTMLLVELALEAGVPAGVLNVVHGGKEVVDGICTHPTSRRSRSSARPPSAPTSTTWAASTASACSR